MDLSFHSALTVLFAGIAIFLLGMEEAKTGLQKLAANRMRELLAKVAGKNYLSIFVGTILTVLLQSSGALTSMLVGLGAAGVVQLPQAMAIMIGSAIGTTFTVQLISFNITQYGLGVFALAYSFKFISHHTQFKQLMSVLVGFGLMFFGIELMGNGAKAISQYDIIKALFADISSMPIASLIAATVFSGIAHSSTVTIGLAMGLAQSGMITYQDALYWVYGANLGTTSTALMSAAGGSYIGRRVAWSYFFYRAVSVVIFVLITSWTVTWIHDSDITRNIANAHTILNIVSAILFYPFITFGARFIEKLIPQPESEKQFGVKFLDRSTYQSTTLAIAHARREIERMGDIVVDMLKDAIRLFETEDEELLAELAGRDSRVDLLNREINAFLLKYANESQEGVDENVFNLISFSSDLESAADVIDHGLLELVRKKNALKLKFSDSSWEDIRQLHREVLRIVELSLSCFQLSDPKLAEEVISAKRKFAKIEKQKQLNHIEQVSKQVRESLNTSSIVFDLLADMRRIVGLMSNHAYNYLPNQDK